MATSQPGPETIQIRLPAGTGFQTRTILNTPLRDATPSEIPIIDIAPLFFPTLASRAAVAAQIREAATNMGFFYVRNHGIDACVFEEAHRACLAYFRQDLDAKMRSNSYSRPYKTGYRACETQRINPDEGLDLREGFSYRYNPRDDPSIADPGDVPELARKHLTYEDYCWDGTESVPEFRVKALRFVAECLTLARVMTRAFALSLGLGEHDWDEKVRYPDGALGLNYYPPIPAPPSPSSSTPSASRVSIGSHTDFQLFTILWQDATPGLQVLSRQGQWLNAKPIEGTLVVNIADCLQRITNDVYVSTVHRAQNHSGGERVSMAFFCGFGQHEMCEVVGSCVGEGQAKKYEDIVCGEYVRMRIENMLRLKD